MSCRARGWMLEGSSREKFVAARRLNTVRRGTGRPLVLVHGLGSSWATWLPIFNRLAATRDVIAVDLPGFGASEPLEVAVTIASLTDAVEQFLRDEALDGADLVGSSMGGRLVLEMARRGHSGSVVALDPGGFWSPGQRTAFSTTVGASIRLIRALDGMLPALTESRIARSALMIQFSAHPWALPPSLVLTELRSFIRAASIDEALDALVNGPTQPGALRTKGRVAIGWGRQDRVTFPSEASVAMQRFPNARFRGFHHCGHFPHWDQPAQTAAFILSATR